jgi:hypothetical protein
MAPVSRRILPERLQWKGRPGRERRWFGIRGDVVCAFIDMFLVILHVHAAMRNVHPPQSCYGGRAYTRKESTAANYHGGAKSSISMVRAILTKAENNLRME